MQSSEERAAGAAGDQETAVSDGVQPASRARQDVEATELAERLRAVVRERDALRETVSRQSEILDLERAVYKISRQLIQASRVDASIDEALAVVGPLCQASRAYVFQFSDDGSRMDNTHEWCAPGVSPQIENLQDLPSDIFPWWMEQLRAWNPIRIPDVAAMPPEAAASQSTLQEQDVRSLLVAPFAIGGRLGGFVGFDNVYGVGEWSDTGALALELLAQTFGNALEREQAISRLREREAQLAAVIEHAPVMIDAFDADGRCTLWNKECERNTGISAAEMLAAEDPMAVMLPDAAFREQLWERIRRGDGQYREYEAELRDGRRRWHMWADYPLPDGGIIGTGLDITERKRAEEALRASEERYRTLVEDMPALVCRFEPDGTLHYVNQAYCDYYGRSADDLIGRSFLDLIPANEQSLVRHHLATLSVDNPVISNEHRVQAPLGGFRWHRWTDRALFDAEGRPVEIQAIGLDITERREIEEALAQYQANLEQMVDDRTAQLIQANAQLVRLSQLKDEFVANVSHEFRTPLTNLLLYMDLAKKNPARLPHYLDVLGREGRRLQQILEAMIDIASLDRQQRDQPEELWPLDDMLINLITDRQTRAVEKQVQVQVEGTLAPVRVQGNRDKLSRVFDILLSNAIAYTPEGGNITLSAAREESGAELWARVIIADTGLGLTAQDREHLFERFYRGEAARKLGVPGSGLGLAIARGLLEKHGGRIVVESAGAGAGTTVTLWLPAET